MNIKKIIILLSLVSFLSCSTDVDIMDCESEQLHTCYATLNITKLPFCDETSSRADGSWFSSITDNLSLRFHNQDGSVSIGYAIYNKEKEIWEVTFNGSITSNKKQKVELFLVRGSYIYSWNDHISFYETTCYYSDSEGEYIRNSNGEISIQATLKPITGRIRFKGVPGDTFTLSGLSTSNYYNIKTGQLTVNDSPITLSIGSNGYSSYIYGNFTNRTNPTMSITVDDCTFTAYCPTSMLNMGKSGWMKLPSWQNHVGWVIDNPDNLINGHEYVDLGLPSGTLWATCNIGANSPEECGDEFAWGETTGLYNGKNVFSWETYKYSNGNDNSLTKYNNDPLLGVVDKKKELDNSDDAAYIQWGCHWSIPSEQQIKELLDSDNTEWKLTSKRNVVGYDVISQRNNNSIFLPLKGQGQIEDYLIGEYWSRTNYTNMHAYILYLRPKECLPGGAGELRFKGLLIRPVINP